MVALPPWLVSSRMGETKGGGVGGGLGGGGKTRPKLILAFPTLKLVDIGVRVLGKDVGMLAIVSLLGRPAPKRAENLSYREPQFKGFPPSIVGLIFLCKYKSLVLFENPESCGLTYL
jgi:hypothetical protein